MTKLTEKETREKYKDFAEIYPVIFKSLMEKSMDMERFKLMAESAECINIQLNRSPEDEDSKKPPEEKEWKF